MLRQIIRIDEEKCNGCGICASACHEGAIDIVGGKAMLVRENFCDGMGDCLPACPQGAISFEDREAPAYDEKAVKKAQALKGAFRPEQTPAKTIGGAASKLRQWPCQIKLVPVEAPYYQGAGILIAADCTAYAYAGMHDEFMNGRITLIACPKLDSVDYTEKLVQIFAYNDIKSVTVVRMEVPCCGGIEIAARKALDMCGKPIPWQVVTISRDGRIIG